MLTGNLILIAIPLLLAGVGAFCAAKEQKALFCLIFGAAVFLVTGFGGLTGAGVSAGDSGRLELLAGPAENTSIKDAAQIQASPADMILLKICLETGIGTRGFMIVRAALQAFLAAAYLYNRKGGQYTGAVFFSACFLPTVFADPDILTAILICLFSAKYIEERRFVRFAAVILAAACFDMSALLMLAVWFITLIPSNIAVLVISGTLAALAAVFPDITGSIFAFFGEGMFSPHTGSIPLAVISGAAALLFMIMKSMLRNRSERSTALIPFAVCGAAFSAASVYVPQLFVISQIMLAVSVTALATDTQWIINRFAEILFPDGKKAVGMTVGTVCAAAAAGICAYIVFSDCFGSSYLGTVLHGEVGLP